MIAVGLFYPASGNDIDQKGKSHQAMAQSGS